MTWLQGFGCAKLLCRPRSSGRSGCSSPFEAAHCKKIIICNSPTQPYLKLCTSKACFSCISQYQLVFSSANYGSTSANMNPARYITCLTGVWEYLMQNLVRMRYSRYKCRVGVFLDTYLRNSLPLRFLSHATRSW